MLASLILAVSVVLAGGVVSPTPGTCACAPARRDGGWCDVHAVGFIGGMEVRSHSLLEVLDAHGHDVDPGSFHCPACQWAIETDGFCAEDRVGFIDGKAYFSRLSHDLASAERVEPEKIGCATCRKNAGAHGWCDACKRGIVGTRAFDERAAYERVVQALAIVHRADETAQRCEYCAVAMVSDSECAICRISYRDGEPVPKGP
jgi:hypothetical protein